MRRAVAMIGLVLLVTGVASRAAADPSTSTPTSTSTPPSLATHPPPPLDTPPTPSRPFYQSTWFWGAIGAMAFAGGALYLVSRDNGSQTIHLEMQVPH